LLAVNRGISAALLCFLIPAREIARIGHSGSYAQSGQNHFLQKKPDNRNSDDNKKTFHGSSSTEIRVLKSVSEQTQAK